VGATVLGADATPAFAAPGPASIDAAPRFTLLDATPLGDDVRLRYDPRPEA
jgi:riboflavin biosynthesis pyrimidine reductase